MRIIFLKICDLGEMDYKEALEIQQRLVLKMQRNEIEDVLLLVEHLPVLTLGLRAKEENILFTREELEKHGISVYKIDRGGDVTYHGTGQIVGYPILNLNNYGRDIHKFVENIEQAFINLLKKEFNISANTDEKYTGVWVGNDKITAIGFSVKKWITMHGFAFNVNTNLEHFNLINPCGITERGVTSLAKLTGKEIDMNETCHMLISYFCETFKVTPQMITRNELLNKIGLD